MAVGARFLSPGWLAGAVGVALLLSGCTGSTTTLPSTTPLTPGGSFVGTLTEATTDASGAPGPASGTSTGPVSPTSLSAPLGLSTPARTGQSPSPSLSLSLSPLSDRPPASTGATTPTSPAPTAPTPASSIAPGGSKVATGPATPPPTVNPPSVTVDTSGLSAQEAADRKAIEQAWLHYWEVYVKINSIPVASRGSALAAVAVDPIKAQILSSALLFDKEKRATYGTVAHRPYWGPPVDGRDTAIMGDCLDTSKYGSMSLSSLDFARV